MGIRHEVILTVALPIATYSADLYHSKCKTKLITLIALAILASIPQVRGFLSHGYQSTVSFLSNPINAGLIGGLIGAIYLTVGRELVNKYKFNLTEETQYHPSTGNEYRVFKIFGKEYLLMPKNDERYHSLLDDTTDDITDDIDYEDRLTAVENHRLPRYSRPTQKKESLYEKLIRNEAFLTFTLPVTAPIASMCRSKRNIVIILLVLTIIATLVGGIPSLRKDIAQAYKIVATFLRNPIHAGLISGIACTAYIAIGNELLMRKKFTIKDDEITIDGVEYTLFRSCATGQIWGSSDFS